MSSSNDEKCGLCGGTGIEPAGYTPCICVDSPVEFPPAGKAVFRVYKDNAGEFRWKLVAPNGQIIATSGEGYKRREGCEEGVMDVVKYCCDKPAVDVSTD